MYNVRQSLNLFSNTLSFVPSEDDDYSQVECRRCKQDDVQYILILLDTSGSIGTKNFSRITEAIGNITAFFCKPIQVAMMTFNQHFHLEFCFDCYENDRLGRNSLSRAIKNISHREGQTYTAAAARCACMEVLNETCGLPDDAECIDIIMITDGRSNDPFLQICEEVKCLHQRGMNTYVIATGDHNNDEIECIRQEDNAMHYLLGNHTHIDEIEKIFVDAISILQTNASDDFSCIANDGYLCKDD